MKAELQNSYWVSEFLLDTPSATLGSIFAPSSRGLGLVESFIIEFNRLVSLLEALLELLDFELKLLFFLLVLGFKG